MEGQQKKMKIAPKAKKKSEKRAPENDSPMEDSGRTDTKRRRKGKIEQEVPLEYALEVRRVSVHHPGDELVVEVADPGEEDDLGDLEQPSDTPPTPGPNPVRKHSILSFFESERGTSSGREMGDPGLNQT